MSGGLRITVPIKIADAMLVATDVAEADYSAWDAGTAYGLAARCIKGHVIWQSLQAANTGHDPQEAGSAWWTKVSATNRWKLFDNEQVTRTAQSTAMYYELAPGTPIDSVHVLGLAGASTVRARLYDTAGGALKYDSGDGAAGKMPTRRDWYGYCFGPWRIDDQLHYTGLPYVLAPRLRVDLAGSADLSCQVLLLGNDTVFGERLSGCGVERGIRVRYERSNALVNNDFDIPTMTSTAAVATVNFDLTVARDEVDALTDFWRRHGNKVCLFNIVETWRTTQVLGKINLFELLLDGPVFSTFSFEIRGVPQQ